MKNNHRLTPEELIKEYPACFDEFKTFEVSFWIQDNDSYDKDIYKVKAIDDAEALELAKEENPRGKEFKIINN